MVGRPRRSKQIPGRRLLKRWREAQDPKVSQAELARRIGCDGSTLRHFELGRSELSLAMAIAVAGETGLPLSTLLPPDLVREIRTAALLLGPNGANEGAA